MSKKLIFFLSALTFLTFSNSLSNGFVGDDEVVIVRNAFYESWDNLPYLFRLEYLTDSRTFYSPDQKYFHSGSVAYRPVLSLTYFLDYWLWQLRPFGYHLHNLASLDHPISHSGRNYV